MTKMDVVIDDRRWPILSIIITRTNLDGSRAVTTNSILHDQAYNKFENDLHNHLRPMVQELVTRRLAK